MDVPDTVSLDKNGQIQTCGDIDAKTLQTRKTIIDKKLENIRLEYGEKNQTHLVLGKLTDEILTFSTDNLFDLIVMGTKGSWGTKETLSGSETQQIARKSTIPVLSLKCDRSDLEIKNILLVHNFSYMHERAFDLLKVFQKAFQSKVHFLQIIESQDEKEMVVSQMNQYAIANNIEEFETHCLVDKDVENGVIHFNQMHEMDLICIGTHGRGGFSHLIKASATEKLLNHLYKPIVSFRIG
jgi:nucleotide-binding universal stress UspA family protein